MPTKKEALEQELQLLTPETPKAQKIEIEIKILAETIKFHEVDIKEFALTEGRTITGHDLLVTQGSTQHTEQYNEALRLKEEADDETNRLGEKMAELYQKNPELIPKKEPTEFRAEPLSIGASLR